jgi:hypothetical protein
METLIELAVAIVSGAVGVILFRLLKSDKTSADNKNVVISVEEKQKKNEELAAKIAQELQDVNKKLEEFEVEKKKDVSPEETADFFNKRKP